MKKIYIGNLPWSTTDTDLEELFSQHGTVHSAVVVTDRTTGRSRGFGFVEMDGAEADVAIAKLDGQELNARPLRVSEAKVDSQRTDAAVRW